MVKDSPTTPSSGTTPNATKTISAGNAIHAKEALRPEPATGEGIVGAGAGRSKCGHCPMTPFMLSANCCGVTESWKSREMLSSSFSAAVGLSAWSHDCGKLLALLATP